MLKTNKLGTTNTTVTSFGVGTTGIAGMFAAVSRAESMNLLETAWKMGVRHFDTAPFYGFGQAERRLGDFLRSKPKEEYTLSTKVGRLLKPDYAAVQRQRFYYTNMPFALDHDYSYDGAMRSLEDSLQRLGLSQIDVALIHDIDILAHGDNQPAIFKQAMEGAYKALEQLRNEGVVKAIGIGVNEWEVCEKALDYGDFDCFLLAGRLSLLDQSAVPTLLPKCMEQNVSLIIGGVFNSGILANPFIENPYYNYQTAPSAIIEKAKAIAEVCQSFGVPIGAAALQYPLRHATVANVISGVRSVREVKEIEEWMNWEISEDLWVKVERDGLVEGI